MKGSVPSLDELKRLFHQFDVDGNGKISPSELQHCIDIIGDRISSEDAEEITHVFDSDGDGLLCFEDFVKLINVEEEEEEEEEKNLLEAFKVYEMEGEGCITPKSLSRALERLGEMKTIDECVAMIRRYDGNGDGVICFEEFKIMML